MFKEKIDCVDLGGLFAFLRNPTYRARAYGGLVGRKTDHSRFILKLSKYKNYD